jgi:hypothetical protein
MKLLSSILASGALILSISTAKADPAPTPATSGAQTMPSGAEPESPPPATYDPGTPGVAPGTPTSAEAASKAAAAAAAPTTSSTTTTTTTEPDTAAPSGTTSTSSTTTTTTTAPATAPAAPPPENFDINTPTPPTTGVPEERPNPTSTNNNVLPAPPNGQTTESVPVAPLPPMPGYEGTYPGAMTYARVGVGLLVGGGFQDFTNGRLKNATGDGGYWTARIIAGTRQFVGMEAAYVGDARSITGLGLGNDARLMSNGLEGDLRLNIPVVRGGALIEPFGFVGLGWSHYTVSQNNATISDFTSSDDVMTLPYGAGLEFGYHGFMADARFTYKQTYFNNLTETSGGNLNNWGVGGQIGFEY